MASSANRPTVAVAVVAARCAVATALSSTLKLTSPPVRVRPDVYRSQSIDSQRSSGVDDGRSSTGTRHSPGSGLKRPRYIGDGTGSLGSRKSDRCDGEDAESLRQLLIDRTENLSTRLTCPERSAAVKGGDEDFHASDPRLTRHQRALVKDALSC
uniref:Uncharacterized protein n=1 Tax=Anopheles farauti TaxID=69004 RepID=A0A182QTA9_9DIPT